MWDLPYVPGTEASIQDNDEDLRCGGVVVVMVGSSGGLVVVS